MASLLDIAPAAKTVPVLGVQIEVMGVSTKGIVTLMTRFPQLADMLGGKDVDVPGLMALSGDIVPAIIAAGCGHPGDEQHEAAASRLPIEAQADLIGAILEVTMPGGFGPFVDRLTRLGSSINLSSVGAAANGHADAAPAVSSPPQ